MKDLDKDWYTYLTAEFKLDQKCYKTADKAVFDCPSCEKVSVVRISHLKAKIKKLGHYICAGCRKKESLKKARKAFETKYGCKNPFQLTSVKAQIKSTNKKRYGVEYPISLSEIRNRKLKGTPYTNVSQIPEVKAKVKNTMKDKFGGFNLENPKILKKALASKEEKEKRLKERVFPEMLKDLRDSDLSASSPEFYKKYEVSYTTLIKWLREANEDSLINGKSILDTMQVSTLSEAGAILANFILKKKIPAAGKIVSEEFSLSRPSIKKALEASGNSDLIGRFKSEKEYQLYLFVESLLQEGDVLRNTRSIIKPKELDIYIPSKKMAIEFHGLYWHDEHHLDKNYHKDKRLACTEKGIQLLQFFEDEWTYKEEIVKSIIRQKLHLTEHKIFARKTEIRTVPKKEAYEFLERTHLMGIFKAGKHIGLYHEDILVCLMTYRKYKSMIDISRFSCELNTSVVGGLSKLLKELGRRESPEAIQSFVDLRYGDGSSLKTLGFTRIKETLGWRWTDWDKTYNRLRCKANMDSQGLTEREQAALFKWVKIYDAGQAKWIKKVSPED